MHMDVAVGVVVIMEVVARVIVQMEALQAVEVVAELSKIIPRQATAVTAQTAQLEFTHGR